VPRGGALILSDVRGLMLSIICEPCSRREAYSVACLVEGHGDAKLTDLLQALADCPKARSANIPIGAGRYSKGFPYRGSPVSAPIEGRARGAFAGRLERRGRLFAVFGESHLRSAGCSQTLIQRSL
jgi:hypothetical protein